MNSDESPASETKARRLPCAGQRWALAISFAAFGFFAGGLLVFFLGFRAASPPPPPPGAGNCGNAVLGGYLLMYIGAPLAAIASAIVASGIGGMVDWFRSRPVGQSSPGENRGFDEFFER